MFFPDTSPFVMQLQNCIIIEFFPYFFLNLINRVKLALNFALFSIIFSGIVLAHNIVMNNIKTFKNQNIPKMSKKLTRHDFSFLAIVSSLLLLIIAGFVL